ncbi:MAG: hypothetical protein HKN13_14855 [Rhodothermales bacterium]|nr:hypothetical protein [Rhodothermales bacterium]
MRTLVKTLTALFLILFVVSGSAFAQMTRVMNDFRYQDKRGINVFESPKTSADDFDGIAIKIGASNALQFQGLSHSNNGFVELLEIGNNFNLATSNLDIDVALDKGVRMHLRTYLSSRHHPEPYVKGGYLQVDNLDFISEGFASDVMEKVTIKVGHMEINYGDNHFRRSDNGSAIFNPFVGNYIMDSFTTEVGGELYYRDNGVLAMLGVTNTKLNQSVVKTDPVTRPAVVAKLGYDSQINEDLRVRLTGSVYRVAEASRVYLYSADRAGARYYRVVTESTGDFRTGRFDPGFRNEITAIMVNPFVKFQGVEVYGVVEISTGKAVAESDTRTFNQFAGEALYRFGRNENVYIGGRYNLVTGTATDGSDVDITRFNVGGGWFLTNNILTKVEYVKQEYKGFDSESIMADAEFSGLAVEAIVSF